MILLLLRFEDLTFGCVPVKRCQVNVVLTKSDKGEEEALSENLSRSICGNV